MTALAHVMSDTTARPAHLTSPTLPDALRLGPVHLTVTDVDRSVDWYTTALGLRVHDRDRDRAALGDGRSVTPVLVLHGDPEARAPGRHAGLYHYALLYPERQELARAALRLSRSRTLIQGASDHGTHEAIYLADPDGTGIELAADRPRELWPTSEKELFGGGPHPLDMDGLLACVNDEQPPVHVARGLRIGHLHLHVGSIADGLAFYRDVLGLQLRGALPSAAFVSAGGYHHHLGFNAWRGEGVGPAPTGTVGLRHWTIELPSAADVAAVRARVQRTGRSVTADEAGFTVRDPWDMSVRFVVTEPATP